MQRLDKILSDAGVGSRKELRGLIRAGRVTVNGHVVLEPESRADGQSDEICVDGRPIRKSRTLVLMMNKPAGYVTSTEDPRDPTVMSLLPEDYRNLGLVPVGRLDKETEGLLLLTNDGSFAHRMIAPKHGVKKIYELEHEGQAEETDVRAFAQGLALKDGTRCRPAVLEPLGSGKSRVVLQEGKYHQVRRMMASRGMHVTYLRRVGEGALCLNGLPLGACRELSKEEINLLQD